MVARCAEAEFDQYVAMVENARQEWMGRVDIRLGMESDYIPGMEPWLETLHGWSNFIMSLVRSIRILKIIEIGLYRRFRCLCSNVF